MLSLLTTNDILIALALAAVLTWIVNRIAATIIVQKTPEFERVLKKCYDMFPGEILRFHGEVYRRGTNIRLTTTQNKVLEGEFLGLGEDNMICIMTKKFIIAQDLVNIERVEKVDLS